MSTHGRIIRHTVLFGALLVAGIGGLRVADAQPAVSTSAATALASSNVEITPRTPRTGYASVMLPDGRYAMLGGFGQSGQIIIQAEVWDTRTQQYGTLTLAGLLPRAHHSATVLPDGRVLIAGGVDARNTPLADIEIWSPATGQTEPLSTRLITARAQHQAHLLPDGRVLLTAGVSTGVSADTASPAKTITTAELIDPTTPYTQGTQAVSAEQAQSLLASLDGAQAPSLYTSTPLAQAQGVDVAQPLVVRFNKHLSSESLGGQTPPSSANPTFTLIGPGGAQALQAVAVERGVMAFITPTRQLLPASRYTLFINGAADKLGQRLPLTAIGFDTQALNTTPGSNTYVTPTPATPAARTAAPPKPTPDPQALAALLADDEMFVPSEEHRKGNWVSGKGVRAQQVQPRNPQLREALYGEQERLQGLLAKRAGTLGAFASGASSSSGGNAGNAATSRQARLEWADIAATVQSADTQGTRQGQTLATGPTSLSGQVLRLNGKPLAKVTLKLGGIQTQTDAQGEFTLNGLPAGTQVLTMDGRSANRSDAQYGVFQYQLNIQGGQANTLPFVVWMPKLDTRHAIKIDSPTRTQTTLSTPLIPGLEVVLPAGTVIRDADGKIVTQVSITPVPVDQTPFPMPYFGVPLFYTLQPGGATIEGVDGKPRAAELRYPNYSGFGPGSAMQLFDYDPQGRGWYVYSQARVSHPDPSQLEANQAFNVYQFTVHSASSGGSEGGGASPSGCGGGGTGGGGGGGWGQGGGGGDSGGACTADPVDLTGGHFLHIERDLYIDDIIPIDIQRTYRTRDNANGTKEFEEVRAFGIGATHLYETYLRLGPNAGGWQYMQLVMPNGRVVRFTGTVDNTYWQTYTNTDATGEFRGAKITPVGSEFVLFLRDGRKWGFPNYNARLAWMEDRNANRLSIERQSPLGYVSKIITPNGRWVNFTYNAAGRVSQITDNLGRSFAYTYDDFQRLTQVTDPLGGKRNYTWANNRIASIKDPNGATRVSNTYDSAWRVSQQTLADGSTFKLAYTTDTNNKITQAEVTDRRGTVRRAEFDASQQLVKNTFALGKPEQYVETYEYTNGQKTAMVDALGRRTQYQYDVVGNLTRVTRMAGTAQALSTTITYDPIFNQPTKVTDPLGHATTLTYDTRGNLTKIVDPLGQATSITYNVQGRPLNITNPLGKITKLAWDGADLSSITDALNRVVQYRTDAAGRITSTTDPLGNRTLQDWDALNRTTSITNPLGGTVKFSFDANGYLKTQVDERGNTAATYTYNSTGQATSVKDALNQTETMTFDGAGQLTSRLDRKGQLSAVTYDILSRTKTISFGASTAAPTAFKSKIELTWDSVGRLTQIVDKTCAPGSVNCATVSATQTTSRVYDNLDRLTQETTPQGQVNYTFDGAGRRTSMTVKNGAPGAQTTQPTISYTYDKADRLSTITQAAGTANGNVAQTITLAYDKANRRTQATLANGSTVAYTYDAAGQLTALTYKKADGTLIGDLSYTYDKAGRRTSMGGSLAKTDLPAANVLDATYDANNRLTRWNGKTFTYDQNGSLIADGVSTYQWDERGQLKGVSTGASALGGFQYDAMGRRSGKTIGGTTTGYVYDGDNFIQELNGTANTSTVKAQLITGGIDETFLREEGNNLHTLLSDANNNTIRILDNTQAKVVDYSYEPYGTTTADTTNANSQQYTGRENDNPGNPNGLYYYRARYYMPGCARFISEDPIGWASGQTNNYSYVGGDPISFRDPSGKIVFNLGLAGLGAAIGGVSAGIAAAQTCGSWGAIGWAVVTGAAGGAVGGFMVGPLATVLAGGAAGFVGDAAGTIIGGGEFNFDNSATAGFMGAWSGGVGVGLAKIGLNPAKNAMGRRAAVGLGVVGLGMSLNQNMLTGAVAGGCAQ